MKADLCIGILYPGHAAEDEYPRLVAMLNMSATVQVIHTETGDFHSVESCLETGKAAYLLEGARELLAFHPAVCMWACTSGSFVFGMEGARAQAAGVAEVLQTPTSSTSLAFLQAIAALGLSRVAVAATYPPDLATAFCTFLAEDGVEVVQLGCMGIWSGGEAGTVVSEAIIHFAVANDHPEAEAILIPDTALHTAELLSTLEQVVGKPVLTANQVTMWEALRLLNSPDFVHSSGPKLGKLFTALPA